MTHASTAALRCPISATHPGPGLVALRVVDDRRTDALPDEELMRRYRVGDAAAFRVLFERYGGPIHRMATRHLRNDDDARDVVQQTFVQMHAARFDFQEDRRFRPWVFTIAMNVIRQVWRKRSRRREVAEEAAPEPVATGEGASDALLRVERARRLRAALEALPASQREVVALHWFEERPFAEVAEIVGSTEGAVKVRAHRAYTKLRGLLEDAPDDDAPAGRTEGGPAHG